MGISGTQIAMNACSIMLLDDNFASIVQAIRWGRNVLEVIRKFLQFQLSVNIAAIVITFLGSIIEGESPLSAVQLLWINLIMDSFGAIGLASDEPDDGILLKPPQSRKSKIITKHMIQYMAAMAPYQVIMCMFVLLKGYEFVGVTKYVGDDQTLQKENVRLIHTLVFTTFVLMQVFNEITTRQLDHEFNFLRGIHKNPWFGIMLAIIVVIQAIAVQFGSAFVQTIPLDGKQWAGCIILAACIVPYMMIARVFFRAYNRWDKQRAEVLPAVIKAGAAPMKEVVVDQKRAPMVNNLVSEAR